MRAVNFPVFAIAGSANECAFFGAYEDSNFAHGLISTKLVTLSVPRQYPLRIPKFIVNLRNCDNYKC